MQVGYYLQTHALHANVIDITPTDPVNDKEQVRQVIVIDGWTSRF